MADGGIDEVIDSKIKPLLDSAMQRYLGVTIDEIRADITDKLKHGPFFEFSLNTDKPYKKAKEMLRAQFLTRLLRRHFGNVSITAKIAGLDRRSMHRLIERHDIDVERFREEMTKRSYLKQTAIATLLEQTIDTYKPALNKDRLDDLYGNLEGISKDIVEVLPENEMTLEDAEREWEKRYLTYHLEAKEWNISQAARAIGLRYETLHRKIKEFGLTPLKQESGPR